MSVSKTNLFDEELRKRANLFKALSHPVRLQILQYMARTRTCLTGDISDMFPLARTTVNQHMKELKETGLILDHLEGAKIVYCLDIEKVKAETAVRAAFITQFA